MTTQVFKDLKFCAAGNHVYMHTTIGIFEPLQNYLIFIKVLQQWFLIFSLLSCVFVLNIIFVYWISFKKHWFISLILDFC